MVKSKFSAWAFVLLPILSISILFVLYITIMRLLTNTFSNEVFGFTCVFILFLWLLIVELYHKAINIAISDDTIHVSRILGCLKTKRLKISEFDGFYTVIMPSKTGNYEYLFLIKDNERFCSISEFYHANYHELKAKVAVTIKNTGPIKFNFLTELIKAFKL